MTLDEFAADVLESVRAEMQCVRNPDGDVQPAVYHLHAGDVRRIELPWGMFHPALKHRLAESIGKAVERARPLMLALEHTVYLRRVRADEMTDVELAAVERGEYPDGWVMPVDHPERIEVVQVNVLDRTSMRTYHAVVERDGINPPTFAPFERQRDGRGDVMLSGAMVDPIRRGMA